MRMKMIVLWRICQHATCQHNFFCVHVMNNIKAQIWIKNILLNSQYPAVDLAKMAEGFRNGQYNVDFKASLLFLLLVCILKGFISWAHHCSVTSWKQFHSDDVVLVLQMVIKTIFEYKVLLGSEACRELCCFLHCLVDANCNCSSGWVSLVAWCDKACQCSHSMLNEGGLWYCGR